MIVELAKGSVRACPLCASEAHLHSDLYTGGFRAGGGRLVLYWVKCANLQCGCTANSDRDQAKVLARWNQRATEVGRLSKRESARQLGTV